MLNFAFFVTNVLLGLGLAMDAFSVALADGLAEPCMKRTKRFFVAGTFAVFQGVMPLLGWVCVHFVMGWFTGLHALIPWISLALLGIIGGKMLFDGLKRGADEDCPCCRSLALATVLVQGVATSIDALSVGFTIAEYSFLPAVVAALLITAVTFPVCLLGLYLGARFGTRFSHRAEVLGGILLILIGIEIFITGLLG